MKRVLFDTNIVLDVLLARQPHCPASTRVLNHAGRGTVEGLLSAHAVTTLDYILRKSLGRAQSRRVLTTLLAKLRVAPVTDAVIRRALVSRVSDFEDAVCDIAAQEAGADVIVTRNITDFEHAMTLAVVPDGLLID